MSVSTNYYGFLRLENSLPGARTFDCVYVDHDGAKKYSVTAVNGRKIDEDGETTYVQVDDLTEGQVRKIPISLNREYPLPKIKDISSEGFYDLRNLIPEYETTRKITNVKEHLNRIIKTNKDCGDKYFQKFSISDQRLYYGRDALDSSEETRITPSLLPVETHTTRCCSGRFLEISVVITIAAGIVLGTLKFTNVI